MTSVRFFSSQMQQYYENTEKEVLQDNSVPIWEFDKVEHITAKRIQKGRLRAVSDAFGLPENQTKEIQGFVNNEVTAKVTAQRFCNHHAMKEKRTQEWLYEELEKRIDTALKQKLRKYCAGQKEIYFGTFHDIFRVHQPSNLVSSDTWKTLYAKALRQIFQSRGFDNIHLNKGEFDLIFS